MVLGLAVLDPLVSLLNQDRYPEQHARASGVNSWRLITLFEYGVVSFDGLIKPCSGLS